VKTRGFADRGDGESENAINLTTNKLETVGIPFRQLKKHPVYGCDEIRVVFSGKRDGFRANMPPRLCGKLCLNSA